MSNLELIKQLVDNKELALTVYGQIPKDSMYMRMNAVFGMYYQYHGEEKQGGKPNSQPLKYVNYADRWVTLPLQGSWDQFAALNGVFSVMDFKFAVVQKYPISILGEKRGWEIVDDHPKGASHYNPLSNKYHREGPGVFTESCTGSFGGQCIWVETTELNTDLDQKFLNLECLLKKLQCQSIYENYRI